MPGPRFTSSFTQQEPISEDGVAAALAVMRSGRLHRYNTVPGEMAEAAALERDYAEWQGARYCLAVASGGQAMQIALRASGVGPGSVVLSNAFTLAPVPGAIAGVGARAALVEITPDLVIDLDDLQDKAQACGATHLLLSHMRGHLCDMDRLMEIAAARNLTVIEDCAHTMGATWSGRRSGNFGLAGCFSTQTYKHMNAGEGGLLTSNDADFMARATILSGSYMLHDRHGAGPGPDAYAAVRLETPNLSARMDNLRAALLRPQIARLDGNVRRWNRLHDHLAARLAAHPAIRLPRRPSQEGYAGSSIQFLIPGISDRDAAGFVSRAAADGVELKWFGAPEPAGFTSTHHSWRYMPAQALPRTDALLAGLFDMRLPLTFDIDDCEVIAEVLLAAADRSDLAGVV